MWMHNYQFIRYHIQTAKVRKKVWHLPSHINFSHAKQSTSQDISWIPLLFARGQPSGTVIQYKHVKSSRLPWKTGGGAGCAPTRLALEELQQLLDANCPTHLPNSDMMRCSVGCVWPFPWGSVAKTAANTDTGPELQSLCTWTRPQTFCQMNLRYSFRSIPLQTATLLIARIDASQFASPLQWITSPSRRSLLLERALTRDKCASGRMPLKKWASELFVWTDPGEGPEGNGWNLKQFPSPQAPFWYW